MESALGRPITGIEEGRNKQHIILHMAFPDAKIPDRAVLPKKLSDKTSEILLGESMDGQVAIDLDKSPHTIVGGATGSGKTTLIITMTGQLIQKEVEVTIIDLKGGQDYPPAWKGKLCNFVTDSQDALSQLSMATQDLQSRLLAFAQVSDAKGVPCSSLDDYNRLCAPTSKLRRKVVVIDEIAELTDTTGMDKPHKELAAKIVQNLSTIARLGRSVGINLIIGTQRPDATVVPGQIKNNLANRICGICDNTLSMIILDNTDAADLIPKNAQGRFILNNTNNGLNATVFQAYYTED